MKKVLCVKKDYFDLILLYFDRNTFFDSEAVLTKLASQLASQSGGVTAEVSRHLFQRLGILLARGNASLITTRSPQYVEASVDGDVDIEL